MLVTATAKGAGGLNLAGKSRETDLACACAGSRNSYRGSDNQSLVADVADVAVSMAGTDRYRSNAFALYASKDASTVSQRLSTLQRWSPNLDIFQDCLDLRPNAAFQPQLEAQIRARDVFLLFWSRNAAASPWVRWEYQTACETKNLNAILSMPLEDPELAPPPAELADRHLRDRFMVAAYALERIRTDSGHA